MRASSSSSREASGCSRYHWAPRQCLVVTELPYQVNPDNLADKIAQLVRDGQVTGIADIRDETSGRTGQRLVIVLKRRCR